VYKYSDISDNVFLVQLAVFCLLLSNSPAFKKKSLLLHETVIWQP